MGLGLAGGSAEDWSSRRAGEKVKEEEEWEEEEEGGGGGDSKRVADDVRDIMQASFKVLLVRPMLLRVWQRGDSHHVGNLVGVGTRLPPPPLLMLLPLSPDNFYDPRSAFGWDDEDDNYDIGKVLQGCGGEEEKMPTTTAETAARCSAPKPYRSRQNGAMMATPPLRALVLSAPPCALLANILLGRREVARKMLSRGNDNNDNGANYGVMSESTSWF